MTDNKQNTSNKDTTSNNVPHSANIDIPRRSSIFGSIFGTLSGSPPIQPAAYPAKNGFAVGSPPIRKTPIDTDTMQSSRPRAFSQGISADEAFNLARANSQTKTQSNHGRRASKGAFESMGMVAAYSGGPSSF